MNLSPALAEKLVIALICSSAGGLVTYGLKAVAIEGRLAAIEHSMARIETRLFPPAPPEK